MDEPRLTKWLKFEVDGVQYEFPVAYLDGTDKQIQWANDIRRSLFKKNAARIKTEVERGNVYARSLLSERSARFWIDARDAKDFDELLKDLKF